MIDTIEIPRRTAITFTGTTGAEGRAHLGRGAWCLTEGGSAYDPYRRTLRRDVAEANGLLPADEPADEPADDTVNQAPEGADTSEE